MMHGCRSTTMHGTKCRSCQHKQHQQRASGCPCHCGGTCELSPLFPGDAYAQYNAGFYPAQHVGVGVGCGFGGCSMDECSGAGGCGSAMADGCSSCGGSQMSDMAMFGNAGSDCGGGHQSSMMPQMENLAPSSLVPNTPAPLAPVEIFESPKTTPADGLLPPNPNDAAPPAAPAVDPVSWEIPTVNTAVSRPPMSGQNAPLRRAQPIPTTVAR